MRTTLERFAAIMEDRLVQNDHRGGWHNATIDVLTADLAGDVHELEGAISFANEVNIAQEAADVAIRAMMIADNSGGIPAAEKFIVDRAAAQKPCLGCGHAADRHWHKRWDCGVVIMEDGGGRVCLCRRCS